MDSGEGVGDVGDMEEELDRLGGALGWDVERRSGCRCGDDDWLSGGAVSSREGVGAQLSTMLNLLFATKEAPANGAGRTT